MGLPDNRRLTRIVLMRAGDGSWQLVVSRRTGTPCISTHGAQIDGPCRSIKRLSGGGPNAVFGGGRNPAITNPIPTSTMEARPLHAQSFMIRVFMR